MSSPNPLFVPRKDPRYRYIFEDMLTGTYLGSIPMYGVNMKRFLATWGQASNYGTFTGTFRADTPGYSVSELLGMTIPGRTNLWVERDGVLIWGGFLTTRTYQSESYTYQIDAQSFDAFMQGQFLTNNGGGTAYDVRNLFINLWNYVQSLTGGNIRVVIPPVVSPDVNPFYNVTWTGTDYSVVSDIISGGVQGGGEYRLDYAYDANGVRRCYLVVGRWDINLLIGTPLSDTSPTFSYPGEISNFWFAESGQNAGTQVLGIGQANTTTTPRDVFTNTAMIGLGWPLYGIKFNWTNITDQTSIDNMLNQALVQYAPPFVTPTYKFNGTSIYGMFDLGDYLHIVLNDQYRFPNGPFINDVRCVGMELSPATDTTVEQANFTVAQPNILG
jgi:hypothetical protein